jgi:hypothetical protein
MLFRPTANVFLAGVLVLAQAYCLIIWLTILTLLGRPTFLPALMYVTINGFVCAIYGIKRTAYLQFSGDMDAV